jgi:two-component system, OmpR family, response regulator RegX3
MLRIAIVEDDADQAQLVRGWLADAGHHPQVYTGSKELIRVIGRESFDVYILDWDLPDEPGLRLLTRLRGELSRAEPVMFCTRMNSEDHVVQALSAGADDYLIKPIKRRELLARLEALMRRQSGKNLLMHQLQIGPYRLDRERRTVHLNGQLLDLTEREFDLSWFLFERVGQVISRSHLLEVVWQRSADVSTRTVDVHLSRLRRKLNLSTETGWVLNAIYQHGYRLGPAG